MKSSSAISSLELWFFKYYRLVHSARIAVAFVVMFAATRTLDLHDITWPLITLVVVMGPISYWGNVFPRALQRISGTCIGALSGIVALYLETISIPLLMIWCSGVMFVCGYLALGKQPYAGLLIGITLAVVLGAHEGNFTQALWRSGDVVLGSAVALFFCSIFPQRAFIHWRLKVSANLLEISKVHHTLLSPNMVERPNIQSKQDQLRRNIIGSRSLLSAASAETKLNFSLLSRIQTGIVNSLYAIERLSDTYWSDRKSHFTLLNSSALKECHQATESMIIQLSEMIKTGKVEADEWQFDNINEVIEELQILAKANQVQSQASLYGYVWLSIQLMEEISRLHKLIALALNLTSKSR
ncbi:FUSC family protein [Vibrio sp. CK2-1]|uniref:FUSC family protein n=1 Tax=Vibrio sp. CK2-1 TaxID=2912249 RepID=UPI001F157662|nr:FUSC family protein [Vibrio sp. CK2-1]MCF7353717.1 FUSC family protein [Vibrio sp. CK2-1]